MVTRTPYILIGCGDSGKEILERVKSIVTKDLVTVVVNSLNINMEELDVLIQSTDMVFICCGVWDSEETIAAGVISGICKTHNVPIIGIAMMPTSGPIMNNFPQENLAILRGYISNLIILDHTNIIQGHPEIQEDHAINLTHQAIGKLINETADLIDTISLFNLEDVWSYRDI